MLYIQHLNCLALVFIIFFFGFTTSFCISCFSFLYCSSSFMFLHFLLSSILCNISEFIQFCFFGNCPSKNLLRNRRNTFFQLVPNFAYVHPLINLLIMQLFVKPCFKSIFNLWF